MLPRRLPPALLLSATLFAAAGCKQGRTIDLSRFFGRKSGQQATEQLQQAIRSAQPAIAQWSGSSDQQAPVQTFYTSRNWELAWSRDGEPTAAAKGLIELFNSAENKGLRPADYETDAWSEREARLSQIHAAHDTSDHAEDVLAQFDAAVTIDAMRYLSDLHLGRINPQALNFDIDVPARRAAWDLPGVLSSQFVDAGDVAAAAAALEPDNPMYKATEQALPKYLTMAKQQAEPLPAVSGKGVSAGGHYAGLSALVQRLALEGDLDANEPAASYDSTIANAVKTYQGRHGLTPSGTLTQATVDSMNVPMTERVQQIELALERWRWLPEPYQKPRVLVNLPEFYVRTYNAGGDLAFKMKVVDGQAKGGEHDTPMFVRMMKYVIFRPYWNLPASIVKKELARHLGASGYLASHGYEVVGKTGKVVEGASADAIAHNEYLVRQKPGPTNSLGLIKFMFPNEYDIYLHSTPEMNLFNLTRRDRSHGCVRLNDAEKMANWVLDGQGDWDAEKIHQAMYGEPLPKSDNSDDDASGASDETPGKPSTTTAVQNNKQVNLKTQLPVVLTYLTANADEDGTMHFFDDIYGYDKALQAALDKPRPYSTAPAKINPHLAMGDTD